tara:strand:+ start:2442 stop:5219 length:2778 start_codon:yes stop_codon:yes gene_type:complete
MARPLVLQDQALMGGLQRDAVGQAKFQSLRQMQNLDLVQDPPALRVRNGYTELSANNPAQYVDTDSSNPELIHIYPTTLRDVNDHLLEFIFYVTAQADGSGYKVRRFRVSNGSDTEIYSSGDGSAEDTGDPLSVNFETVNNRVFFSVDDHLRWTDYNSSSSYQAGLVNPTGVPDFSGSNRVDNDQNDASNDWGGNGGSKLGAGVSQNFTVGSTAIVINLITVWIKIDNPFIDNGNLKCRLEGVNSTTGDPNGILVSDDADTGWRHVSSFFDNTSTDDATDSTGPYTPLIIRMNPVLLAANTTYSVVIEADSSLQNEQLAIDDSGATNIAGQMARVWSWVNSVNSSMVLKEKKAGVNTNLNGGISANETSIIVDDASRIEASSNIKIGSEIITVNSKNSNTLSVTRGQSNSTQSAHDDDAIVTAGWDTASGGGSLRFAHSQPRSQINYPFAALNESTGSNDYGGYVADQDGGSISKNYGITYRWGSKGLESSLVLIKDIFFTGDRDNARGVMISSFPTLTSPATSIGVYRQIVTGTSGSSTLSQNYYRVYDLGSSPSSFIDFTDDVQLSSGPSLPSFLATSTLPTVADQDGNSIGLKDLTYWNERMWGFKGDTIYFSMRLETESASFGQVGDSLPDYFPALNTFAMNRPITGIKALREGLVVFHRNSISMLTGGYSPLNPPPDLQMRNISASEGVTSSDMVTEVEGSLFYYNNHQELKIFSPAGATREISDINQSIFNDVTKVVKVISYKRNIVVGVEIADASSSGRITDLFILDMGEQFPFWKSYKYMLTATSPQYLRGLAVNDSHVLYASGLSSSNERALILDNGATDNGVAIPALAETHEIASGRREQWRKYHLEFNYSSTVPSVTATATAKDGTTSGRTFTATGSNDIRNHHGGLRILSESCRFKVNWNASGPDELLLLGFE